MRLHVRICIMGAATVALACAPKVAPLQQQPAVLPVVVAARQLTSATLVGVARAPVALAGAQSLQGGVLVGDSSKIITNDGGSLISNDGGGLITNDGAGLKLLQAPDDLAELPLAGAVALARDARTRALLKYVKPATTDAHGQFTLKGLPADVTVMVEIVFVAKDGAKALRMASLAHVARQAAARPVAVTLATTLATAALTRDAATGAGQIYLIKQQDIEATATTIQAAIDKDASRKREVAQAIAIQPDAKGAVAVDLAMPASPQPAVAAAADAVVKADATVAQAVQLQQETLAKPVPVELQPLVTAVDDATRGTATPEPAPSPSPSATLAVASTGIAISRVSPSPTPVPSATPSVTLAWERVPSPSPTASPKYPVETPEPEATVFTKGSPSPQPTNDTIDVQLGGLKTTP